MDVQDQIYIIIGVFGAGLLIAVICISYLLYKVSKLNNIVNGGGQKSDKRGRDIYAYNNPAIVPGEELNRRGYAMHDGGPPKAPPRLVNTGPNRFGAAQSPPGRYDYEDRGSKDASKDFSNILNNDDIVFGGSGAKSKNPNSGRDNAQYGGAGGRSSNYNDNITYPSNLVNPLTQQDKAYYNRGMNY